MVFPFFENLIKFSSLRHDITNTCIYLVELELFVKEWLEVTKKNFFMNTK